MAKIKKRQPQMTGLRAVTYARVSNQSQAEEDKTSLSEQDVDMETLGGNLGLTIVNHYQDVGAGWSKNLPGFQRMLADAKLGLFDIIICWKSDRLCRGIYRAAAIMEVVEAHGIRLVSVKDTIDMKTFGLMAAIAKMELDSIRERTTMGKRGAAKQGRIPNGAVPYGYRIGDDGRPEIYEPEAEVVRRIFRRYVEERLGGNEITLRLNNENAPTSKPGSRWHQAFVTALISKEVYKGVWWYGKNRWTSTEDGEVVHPQPEDSWISVPFPPLVSPETWDRAQLIKKERIIQSARNTTEFYMLPRMVTCDVCNRFFGCRSSKRKKVKSQGEVYMRDRETPIQYYLCYGMSNDGSKCREHPYIRADRLEEVVVAEVKRMFQNPDLILAGLKSMDSEDDYGLAKQLARAEKDLKKVQVEDSRAVGLYVSGKITERELDHQRKFINERMETAHARAEDYRAQASMKAEKKALAGNIVRWVEKIGEGIDNLPPEDLREVLRLVVDKIVIDRDNHVTITMGIPTDGLMSIDKEASPSPYDCNTATPPPGAPRFFPLILPRPTKKVLRSFSKSGSHTPTPLRPLP